MRGKTFVGSKDSKGVMILTFDSKFDSLARAESGFSLKVDAVDKCKWCFMSLPKATDYARKSVITLWKSLKNALEI